MNEEVGRKKEVDLRVTYRSHALRGNAALDALRREWIGSVFSGKDAERPRRRYHAERGNDRCIEELAA